VGDYHRGEKRENGEDRRQGDVLLLLQGDEKSHKLIPPNDGVGLAWACQRRTCHLLLLPAGGDTLLLQLLLALELAPHACQLALDIR
jgi:hypothetical protein